MKKRFLFQVMTDSPYPVTTNGGAEATTWESATRLAVKKHREELKKQGRLRKFGKSVTVKVWLED